LKQAITLNRISDEQEAALKAFQHAEFPISDAIMSRCISTAISLVWTDEQIKEKGEKMVEVIRKVIG
jgi:8-amino-3,8-dideoxy-alpha-D-manno-octulosonate transaminase